MILALKILGGIAALALGIWLGMPGRYTQSVEEIEESLGKRGRRRTAKRHFTPLAWFQRQVSSGSTSQKRRDRSRRRSGGGFKLEDPEDR